MEAAGSSSTAACEDDVEVVGERTNEERNAELRKEAVELSTATPILEPVQPVVFVQRAPKQNLACNSV